MRRRHHGFEWIFFLLLAALILSGAWLYVNWQSSQTMLPPGLEINGQPMGGMTPEQALHAISLAYTTPITVYYADTLTPPLLPEMIELSLDEEATAENLEEALHAQRQAQGFVDYVLDRVLQRETEVLEVNAVVTYSRERVNAFLQRMAQKYDHPPQKPVPLPEAGTFRPPQEGTTLDIEASLPPLIDAILAAAPEERQVELVVEIEPAPEASIDILRDALTTALADFDGVVGIFAKDLRSGHELCLNCEVPFSGLSTLKIGIAMELYRQLDATPDDETRQLLNQMLTESDNAAANLLLVRIGAGTPYSGATYVTDFLHSLGMHHTFMAAPYDLKEGITPPEPLPNDVGSEFDTNPDPYIQTTPMEMGLLLEGVYQCAKGGGFLRILYPQRITPGECQDVLAWMEYNQIHSLLSADLPEGVRVAHKHGWAGETHADLSLIYGPERDFILVVYLYQTEWLVWEESVPTFSKIGELTYRFFNGEE